MWKEQLQIGTTTMGSNIPTKPKKKKNCREKLFKIADRLKVIGNELADSVTEDKWEFQHWDHEIKTFIDTDGIRGKGAYGWSHNVDDNLHSLAIIYTFVSDNINEKDACFVLQHLKEMYSDKNWYSNFTGSKIDAEFYSRGFVSAKWYIADDAHDPISFDIGYLKVTGKHFPYEEKPAFEAEGDKWYNKIRDAILSVDI